VAAVDPARGVGHGADNEGMIRRHALSFLLLALALPLGVVSFSYSPPAAQDLREISGRVGTVARQGTGIVFTIDGVAGRFFNDSIGGYGAEMLEAPGTVVRTYIEKDDRSPLLEGGAIRTWGLWANGSRIAWMEDDLGSDHFFSRWILRPITLVLLGVAITRLLRPQDLVERA